MGFLSTLINQFGQMINSQSVARRLALLGIVLGSVGALVWLMLRAQTGGYTVILSGLQPAEVGEASNKLRQLGIGVRLDQAGASLMVPRNKADEAIIALSMEGIPNSGTVGFELMDKSALGQSNFQQQKNYHRMREGELARTLMSIREIERARVHLALPEPSVFTRDTQQPTASVVIKLRGGAKPGDRMINGIVHFISHGVPGLEPERVSVIDSAGNLLNSTHADDSMFASVAQQTYKTQYEETLKTRIESMLENVLGKGSVSARVQADFDFSTIREVKETFNPDDQDQIIRSQKISTEGRADAGAGAGSKLAAGSSSNLPAATTGGPGANAAATGPGTSRTDSTIEYAVSSSKQEMTQNVPQPTRLTVAVLVDGKYEADPDNKDGKGKFVPLSAEELAKYEQLVKDTIGFKEERQDNVTLACEAFRHDETADLGPVSNWQMRRLMEMGIQWGIVGLIGLLLILFVLRPAVKQIVVMPAAGGGAGLLEGPMAVLQHSREARRGLPAGASGAPGVAGELPAGADLGDLDLPPGVNPETARAMKMQRIAAHQAKVSSAQANEVHKEVVETAKSDPRKTAGLLRQWMDEA